MKYILPYLKKYRLMCILAPLFKMLEACFDLAVPLIVAGMINVGISSGDGGYILSRFALLAAMAALGLLSSYAAQYFAARAAVSTACALRRRLLEKIQGFDFSTLDCVGNSTLITRLTSDVNRVQNGINMFLRLFLRSPFIVFGAFAAAFYINAAAAAVFAAVILVLFLIVFGIMRITAPMYRDVQAGLDDVTASTREAVNGVRVIRAFGKEEATQRRFERVSSLLEAAQRRAGNVAALMNPLTYAAVNCAIVLVLQICAGKVNAGLVRYGDVVALINYIGQILIELVKLANLIDVLGKVVSSVRRVEAVLDTPCEMTFNGSKSLSVTREAVRFENVSLKYRTGGENALSDISFSANYGETVGIIGSTGSGKSSLVNLIPRFYDATYGCVYVGGEPVRELSRAALLAAVAVVPQKSRLFSGTVRENLLWGCENASDEVLLQALETAQAADFIKEKPRGLDEKVAPGGENFSGGQKQRLCIARALCKNAKILILDDSASALDYATEAALRQSLRTLAADKCVFIVSQRTSSVMHADKILVMEDGRLCDCGTHAELLARCETYREIHESQFETEAAK